MRRDMDLVRQILLDVAESQVPLTASALAIDSVPPELIMFHLRLMHHADLIEVEFANSIGGATASVQRLTWAGSDFLEAVASDDVWSKTKKLIAKTTGSAPFEVFRAVAVQVCKELILGK